MKGSTFGKPNIPTKRDILRSIGYQIREPVSAIKRDQALKKARYKCQYSRCTIKEGGSIKLDVHHKNQKNYDNRPSNLMVFCKTHHGAWHKEHPVKREKDVLGRTTKIIKVKPKSKKKKTRNSPLNILKPTQK